MHDTVHSTVLVDVGKFVSDWEIHRSPSDDSTKVDIQELQNECKLQTYIENICLSKFKPGYYLLRAETGKHEEGESGTHSRLKNPVS